MEFSKEELIKLLKTQKEFAKIKKLTDPSQPYGKMIKKQDGTEFVNNYYWTGYYNTWKLEAIHIADAFELTAKGLTKKIYETEDTELIDKWNYYQYSYSVSVFHDPAMKNLQKDIAEHKLKIFDKNETITDPIIIQEVEIKDFAKLLKLEEDEIEEEFKETK